MKAKEAHNHSSVIGLAAGMYSGLTYGLKEARGTHDWVILLITVFLLLYDDDACSVVLCSFVECAKL